MVGGELAVHREVLGPKVYREEVISAEGRDLLFLEDDDTRDERDEEYDQTAQDQPSCLSLFVRQHDFRSL